MSWLGIISCCCCEVEELCLAQLFKVNGYEMDNFDFQQRKRFYFSHHAGSEDSGISYSTGPAKSFSVDEAVRT
jgi:hypothetical protein